MKKNYGLCLSNDYLALPTCFYTKVHPTPVKAPEMVILNHDLMHDLGLDFLNLGAKQQAELFSGNRLLEEDRYFAQAYAGHQFGHFSLLGDGRAIGWGEHTTPKGKRFDIQFKGAGRTAYSRRGDGRAALGPMLREYLISEAMYYLGIPTTRSLAVVKTGELVQREMLLTGAILTRVASSHLRVGTFEFAACQSDPQAISALLEHTVQHHYPNIANSPNRAVALLEVVIHQQAELVCHWMRVGFIHGVMNTDNMALSGETIDYGPCAFMDHYDPRTVLSSIDHTGRYAYQNQPSIAQWDLARFAESLLPLIHSDPKKAVRIAEESINEFTLIYHNKWLAMMRAKLGLFGQEQADTQLIAELLTWMKKNQLDYTNTFRDLSQTDKPAGQIYDTKSFSEWYGRWQVRRSNHSASLERSVKLMQATNPAVIPRNHKVEEVLAAAEEGHLSPLQEMLDVLKQPYLTTSRSMPYQIPPSPAERVYQTFCGT